MRIPFTFLFLIGASALPFTSLTLSAAQPRITADENFYDAETRQLVFIGDAVLEHEDYVVEADQIRYDRETERATATGNVRITQPGLRLVGHRVIYNIQTRQFESDDFRIGVPPIMASGRSFSGDPQNIHLNDARFHLGEPHPHAPTVFANQAEVEDGETLRLNDVRFAPGILPGSIGTGAAIPLPDFTGPLEDPGVRFRGDIGFRSNLGAYFQTDTLFPVARRLRLGAALDAYSKRGVLIGPAMQWRATDGHTQWLSDVRSGYIQDGGDRGTDRLGNPIDRDRAYFSLRQKLTHRETINLTAKVDWLSDSEVLRDFRDQWFWADQEPDNFVEASYLWKHTLLSFFARFDPNETHTTVERLPEIRLDHLGSNLPWLGLRQEFSLSYARMREARIDFTPVAPAPALRLLHRADRFDAWHVLRRPIRIAKWADVTPIVGGRVTHWSRADGLSGSHTRWMGLVGFDFALSAHADWAVRNAIWGIDGIRHLIRPVVQYRWMPGGSDNTSSLFAIDRHVYMPHRPPIDFHLMRNVDQFDDLHLIRAGIENLFQTRSRKNGARTLFEANIYQDLHLHEPASGMPRHSTFMQARLRPAPWLEVDWEHHLDTEGLRRYADRFRITIVDGNVWRLTLFSEFLTSTFEQYGADLYTRLSDNFALHAHVRYDQLLSQWTEQRYALIQQLGRSWEIEYRVSTIRGSSREDDFRISLGLRFTGL